MAADSTIRRVVHFTGNVQGVGFRYQTQSVANRYEVSGYVENLADGRVLVVAEGVREEVEAFLDDVTARMAGAIRDRSESDRPSTGEFTGFKIRH